MSEQSASIVSTERHPARAVVRVRGELDRVGIARLRTELSGWREAGPVALWLDLAAVPRCDPGLARVLGWARTQLRGDGGDLIVTGATEQVLAEIADEVAVVDAFAGWHSDWQASLIERCEPARS
jgi:anti-anti-sigma regulatory factor